MRVGDSTEDLLLKRNLDRLYTECPFFLVPAGWWENWPNRLSGNGENHEKFLYLLHGFKVGEADKVWAANITYIPMEGGFMYLAATLDWYSRYVVSWKLSNSLESLFCLDVLNDPTPAGIAS